MSPPADPGFLGGSLADEPDESPHHIDPPHGLEVFASESVPRRPVAISLPSDVWLDTDAARAFARAILAVADYADAHPELFAPRPAP